MNDYVYQLTDLGRERARRFMDHCTYFGSAPVSLMDYIIGVKAQSLEKQHPSADDLKRAFEDILGQRSDAAAAGAGDQLGPRLVSVRRGRQRQDDASPSGSRGRLANSSGFRGRSASTARSCGCSTR